MFSAGREEVVTFTVDSLEWIPMAIVKNAYLHNPQPKFLKSVRGLR